VNLVISLMEIGLLPVGFASEEDKNGSRVASPRDKRKKQKEVGLKRIDKLLERVETTPLILPPKKPKKKVKIPRAPSMSSFVGTEPKEADDILSFEDLSSTEDSDDDSTTKSKEDLDLHYALSLEYDSIHICQKLSRSRELTNPTAWPSLSTPVSSPKPKIEPVSAWPSLSPQKPPSTVRPNAWGSPALKMKLTSPPEKNEA